MKTKTPVAAICKVILFTLVAISATRAFPLPAYSSFSTAADSLVFNLEVLSLNTDDPELSRLDVYVGIVNDELQFLKAGPDSFQAEYSVFVEVRNAGGEKIDSSKFHTQVKVAEITNVMSLESLNINRLTFSLPPDEYQVVARLKDLETNLIGVRKTTAVLHEYPEGEFAVSGIIFLDDVNKNVENKFTFQPHVSVYQNQQRMIFAHFEVYNVTAPDSFWVHYTVRDKDGSVVKENEYWEKSAGEITQNFINIEGEALPHGKYFASFEIRAHDKTVYTEKGFKWYVDGFPMEIVNIEEAIKVLKYMSSNKEYKQLMAANQTDKFQKFTDFWKEHDPTPLTSRNEQRDEYYRRVAYSNKKYKSLGVDGWKTDRGWVYILLGPPDSIDRNPYNINISAVGKSVKAIQVWNYYQYNRQLIFYDDNGFGHFLLANPQTFYDIIR